MLTVSREAILNVDNTYRAVLTPQGRILDRNRQRRILSDRTQVKGIIDYPSHPSFLKVTKHVSEHSERRGPHNLHRRHQDSMRVYSKGTGMKGTVV